MRRPEVPGFWPSMGDVSFLVTLKRTMTGREARKMGEGERGERGEGGLIERGEEEEGRSGR